MNADILNQRRSAALPRRDVVSKPVPTLEMVATLEIVAPADQTRSALDTDVLSARLLRDAVREAGLFQRSVLGHLDHKEWRDRVCADGQRLVDLLAKIGFRPSEDRTDSYGRAGN